MELLVVTIRSLCAAAVALIWFSGVAAFAQDGAAAPGAPAVAASPDTGPAVAAVPAPAAVTEIAETAAGTGDRLPDMTMGDDKAPVTIVEYSSLSCPHCAAYHKETFPGLKEKYIDTGKVKYIIREFPLNQTALAGSVIARCVDRTHFYAFVDMLFAKQEGWAFQSDSLTPLKNFAHQAGLSDDRFNKCLYDPALQKKVIEVRDEGSKKGVNSTPTLIVNGKPLEGAATIANLEKAMKPYLGS